MESLVDLFEGYRLVKDVLCELFDVEKFLSRAQGVQELINRGGTEGEKAAAREAMARMTARAEEQKAELSPQERARFEARFSAIRNGQASASRPRPNFHREPPPREKPREQPKNYSNFKVGDWVELNGAIGQIVQKLPPAMDRDLFVVRWMTGPKRGEETKVSHVNLRKTDPNGKQSGPGGNTGNSQTGGNSQGSSNNNNNGNSQGEASFKVFYAARFTEGTSDKIYGVAKHNGRIFTFWGRFGGSLATKDFPSLGEAQDVFQSKIRKGYRETTVDSFLTNLVRQSLR